MYGYEIFHQELMKTLIQSVRNNTSSHAYIFEGAKGLFIENCASLFASALVCGNQDAAPCGSCSSCIESKAKTNPDIIYVSPGDRKTIGAEKMRELEEDVAIKPFSSKHKVYIFEDGMLLTEAAQNVFLKIFEEPPEYAVFIIIIENASLLLDTILSRFTLINFSPVSNSVTEEYIKNHYPEEKERFDFLVRYCGGVPGRVDKIVEDEEFENLRTAALDFLPSLISHDRQRAFDFEKFFEEKRERIKEILDFIFIYLRDIVLIQSGVYDKVINVDKLDILRSIGAKYNPSNIINLSDRTIEAQKMIGRYVSPKAIALWLGL